MTEQVVQRALCVEAGTDADDEELSEPATHLREQLLELDIERADLVTAGETPSGTCAAEIVEAGALTRSWTTHQTNRSV